MEQTLYFTLYFMLLGINFMLLVKLFGMSLVKSIAQYMPVIEDINIETMDNQESFILVSKLKRIKLHIQLEHASGILLILLMILSMVSGFKLSAAFLFIVSIDLINTISFEKKLYQSKKPEKKWYIIGYMFLSCFQVIGYLYILFKLYNLF